MEKEKKEREEKERQRKREERDRRFEQNLGFDDEARKQPAKPKELSI